MKQVLSSKGRILAAIGLYLTLRGMVADIN